MFVRGYVLVSIFPGRLEWISLAFRPLLFPFGRFVGRLRFLAVLRSCLCDKGCLHSPSDSWNKFPCVLLVECCKLVRLLSFSLP